MRNVIFAKGDFIIIRNSKYFTVVNKNPPSKKNKREYHCHLNKDELNAARMIAIWAYKIQTEHCEEWPKQYPRWMQERLDRLLHGKGV